MFQVSRYNDDDAPKHDNSLLPTMKKPVAKKEKETGHKRKRDNNNEDSYDIDAEVDEAFAMEEIKLGPVEGAELALAALVKGRRKRAEGGERDGGSAVTASIAEEGKEWGLHEALVHAATGRGMKGFFPIQRKAVPFIMRGDASGLGGDIYVSAPTGSGKTLVYVLPILQLCLNSVVKRLRALVILPTRDLAIQVKKVFDEFSKGTNVKIGLAIGQNSFSDEQWDLCGVGKGLVSGGSAAGAGAGAGGHSEVDVLVCTPGRLIDHLSKTEGFTLQHLKYLVLDEADRLLMQSYQDWITKVNTALSEGQMKAGSVTRSDDGRSLTIDATALGVKSVNRHLISELRVVRRILVSATLTQNPAKIASLSLVNPVHFNAQGMVGEAGVEVAEDSNVEKYVTPERLKEYLIMCNSGEKPLLLIWLLNQFKKKGEQTIIFTASVTATHRLRRLLEIYGGEWGKLREYSATLSQRDRTAILREMRSKDISIVVCSDSMARGLDIDSVANVVNYDVPVYAKTYIHRVGRTARAGREGSSYTLLDMKQMHHFKQLLRHVETSFVQPLIVNREEAIKPLVVNYTKCLRELKRVIDRENRGEIGVSDSVLVSAVGGHASGEEGEGAGGGGAVITVGDEATLSVIRSNLLRNYNVTV